MKLNTLENLYNSILNEQFEVKVDKELADKAKIIYLKDDTDINNIVDLQIYFSFFGFPP